MSTPRSMRSRASTENFTSLAAIGITPVECAEDGLGDDAHHVGFLHDDEVFAIELHFGARPFAEQDAVADLDVDRDQLAGIVAAAGTDGDHFAFGRLFLSAVRNDDAAL